MDNPLIAPRPVQYSGVSNSCCSFPEAHRIRGDMYQLRAITKEGSIVLGAAILWTACTSPESRFERAEAVGTVPAYQEFIAENPDHWLATRAKSRILSLSYAEATGLNTAEAYEAFAKEFPNSPEADKAAKRAAEIRYKKPKREHVVSPTPGPVIPFYESDVRNLDTGKTTRMTFAPDGQPFTLDATLLRFMKHWLFEEVTSFGIGWSLEIGPPVGLRFEDQHLIKRVKDLREKEMAQAGITKHWNGGYRLDFRYKGLRYKKHVDSDAHVVLPKDTGKLGAMYRSKYPLVVEVSSAFRRREHRREVSFLRGFGAIRSRDRGSIRLTAETLESILLGQGCHLRMDNYYMKGSKGWKLEVIYNNGTTAPVTLGARGREFEEAFFASRVGFIRYSGEDSVELTRKSLSDLLPLLDESSAKRSYYNILSGINLMDPRSTRGVPIFIEEKRARLELGRKGQEIIEAFFKRVK